MMTIQMYVWIQNQKTLTSKYPSDTTAETLQNNNDDNKKHKDPFLLPFP